MFRCPCILVSAIVAAFTINVDSALAHSGAGEPLFVAGNGLDRGRCLDEASPCRTVRYALSVAGKGAELRIAEGAYAIEDPADLFHVISGMVNVNGGFRQRGGRFAERTGVSTLTGVPPQFRQQLKDRGFNIVSDRKAIDGRKAAVADELVALHAQLKAGVPAGPCSGGKAGELDCEAVDLLSHFSFSDVSRSPASATDVWGFVDLNTNREYAIVGYDVGTAVVDVTDPADPREVGFIDGQLAFWRDIKVYQFFDAAADRWRAYAYVSTDGSTDGLFVIDMSGLPQSVRRTGYASDFVAAHNVYATNTDYSTGIALTDNAPLLAVSGSSLGSGQYRGYSLENPAQPAFVAGAGSPDYMHDAASLIVTDARKDSQCVNAVAWCEVLLDFNEQTIDVWDITDAANPERLSRTPYANASYVHSGWWAEDRQHIFVHDELDEQNLGLNTTVRVFSIANLEAPVPVGSWTGTSRAIDHNGFVRGNRYYVSNYARGLTILDITNPSAPETVGSLDTYPFSDNSGFVGAWGAYPFWFSGTIGISDIDTGLYLARDRSTDVEQGRFTFDAPAYGADEGGTALLVVQRLGGASGAVSVDYEMLHASAGSDDHQLQTGTLTWTAGDAASRTIAVPLANDGLQEGLERLLVRLVNPAGSATLGATNVASVYISDPGAAAEIGFLSDSVATAERGFATAVLVLQRHGSATAAASVDYAVSGGDATPGADFSGATAGSVHWAAGDGEPKSVLFRIIDEGISEETETIEITLSNATGASVRGSSTATIQITNGSGVNAAPNAIAGGNQTVVPGTLVTLDGSQSNDADGDGLEYAWEQIGGPDVSLSASDAATTRFTAPASGSDVLLQFRLTVTDPSGLTDSATTTVTVSNSSGANGGGSGGGSFGLPFLMLAAYRFTRSPRKGDA